MTDGESLSPAEPSQAATKKKNLTLRVFSTIVGVPLLTFLIFAEASPIKYPAIIYVVAGMFFSTTAAIEFFAAARRRNYQPVTPLAVTAVALLQLYAWQTAPPGLGFILTSFFALLLTLALLHTVLTAKGDGAVVVNLGVTMTGVAYTGWLFSYLIRLRTMAGIPIVSPFGTASFGAWLALFVFFVTFAGDTAAFFVGRSLGRRPLSPRLSPGKTVEGSIGGIGGGGRDGFASGALDGISAMEEHFAGRRVQRHGTDGRPVCVRPEARFADEGLRRGVAGYGRCFGSVRFNPLLRTDHLLSV